MKAVIAVKANIRGIGNRIMCYCSSIETAKDVSETLKLHFKVLYSDIHYENSFDDVNSAVNHCCHLLDHEY
jgi:disulfide oxidoreductase YuzD